MKRIQHSLSQAGQDSFVMNMLGWKTNGFYLEVGAGFYYNLSNTYALEKEYGWDGVSLEFDPNMCYDFNENRNNPCHCIDATTADYDQLLSSCNAPQQIDYLQLDIDPTKNTLQALKQIPLDKYRFSVVTFEHDLYNDPGNKQHKLDACDILTGAGYQLVVSNVSCNDSGGGAFEDWYVDPKAVPESIWRQAINSDVHCSSLFE